MIITNYIGTLKWMTYTFLQNLIKGVVEKIKAQNNNKRKQCETMETLWITK